MAPSPVVVDTSALLDYLLGEPSAEHMDELLGQPQVALHAPEILDQELVSVARRLERADELTERRATEMLRDAAELPIELHPLRPHMERVWSLRKSVWVSDAYFISLAEALRAPLMTTDEKLVRSIATVRGLHIQVITPEGRL